MDQIWVIKPRNKKDLIDQILENRGTKDKEKFLYPNFLKDTYDPFLMKNLKEATLRIKTAFLNQEKIGIFSDYDADGIPGAALLYKALIKTGIKCQVYIPNREGGYGLSREGIDLLISKNCKLIITVDLGIKNFEEALYCKEKKIDLIITDHHLPDDLLPDALVINPKIKGCHYPFKDLSGCGVAYKLIQGLSNFFPKEIDEKFLKWNLDLVAISTISDVVPLQDENRLFAKYGLVVLKKSKNIGLRELIKISGIETERIDAYTAGFQIGPRINAPGRIDHATKSFELLITEDREEAKELANFLNEKNKDRQLEMEKVIESAIKKIKESKLDQNNIIILTGKWLKGIIGPSASRITELFSRPTILFSEDKLEYVGSARSIEGVNIIDLLKKAEKNIEKFGGHKGAAGLTVSRKKFSDFISMITSYANKIIKQEDLIKKIKIEAEVEPKEISLSFADDMSKLEPFGFGNSKPLFAIKNVKIKSVRTVGSQKNHLSFIVEKDNKQTKAIYFNYDSDLDLSKNNTFDIAFCPMINQWNGTRSINYNIQGIKANES